MAQRKKGGMRPEGKAASGSRAGGDKVLPDSGVAEKVTAEPAGPGREEPGSAGFHIVALGASAGGLEALQTFFHRMQPDSGLAFVVIQHLSPDFKSLMDELLARHTSMSIHRVESGMELQPDSVYLIPPKKSMTVQDGRLILEDRKADGHLDLPIDVFFRSLAKDAGERAIAVVLSGTGSDGSRGIRDVNEAGGLVVVQSPESAKFDGMPRSAIASGAVDLVLPPEAMPDMIVKYISNPMSVRHAGEDDSLRHIQDDDGTTAVFKLLKRQYGIDFADYKPTTVGRRLARRMSIRQINSLTDYLAFLSANADELNSLYKDLLIGVTSFFRDQPAFEALERKAVPEIFVGAAGQDEVRAWIAGCATGEEAYSVAMLLVEGAERSGFHGKISVFATDAHKESLDTASLGIYEKTRLSSVSPARLARFFKEESPTHMRVNQDLRSHIVFAQHNIISDPPFTKMDLVTCRNLLIYLHPAAQDKALAMFHFALRVGGLVFLGSSESPGGLVEEFEPLDSKCKIFRKLRDVKLALDFKLSHQERERPAPPPLATAAGLDRRILQDYDQLLRKHLPSGLLLNERREVLHIFGDGGRYLTRLEGRAVRDVLDMVEGDLRLALGTAVQRAGTRKDKVIFKGVTVGQGKEKRKIDVEVEALPDERTRSNHFHVSFLDQGPAAKRAKRVEKPLPDEDFQIDDATRQRMGELEVELQSTRENLQATIEELQTTNEELQATNEEMLAANEELQSTNEELHSVNEELYTVNAEFEKKNKELSQLNEDYDNLLRSSDIGTLFLDRDLQIRRYNPAISLTFKLLPQDIGRPVDHIAYRLDGQAQMIEDLKKVLADGEPLEKEVRTKDGKWLLKRILPFLTADNHQDGVVLTFTDITRVKEMEAERRQSEAMREMAASVPGAVFQFVSDKSGEETFSFVNEGARSIFGVDPAQILKDARVLLRLIHHDDVDMLRIKVRESREKLETLDAEHRIVVPGGGVRWLHTRCTPSLASGGVTRWSGVSLDITARKLAEEQLKRASEFHLSILNKSPALIWRSGLDGMCNWFNATWLAYTGKSLEDEQGEGWTKGVHPQDVARCLNVYKRAFRQRKPFRMDYRLRRHDGVYRWIHDVGTPYDDLDGKFAGFIGYCFDITEAKEASGKMRQAMEMMANANRIKSEFLANMSHEIRTPLHGMLGMLQLLSMTSLNEEQKEYVDASTGSGRRLLSLINEILDLSKIEAGKFVIAEQLFDFDSVVDLALKNFEYAVREKGLTLNVKGEKGGERHFVGDSARISQVLLNILGNAIKFTNKGTVTLETRVAEEPGLPGKRRIFFTVTDTGIGIPEGKLADVYEPFVQASVSYQRAHQGTGLGLTIAKRLVGLMDGDLSIESEEGKGTTVSFSVLVGVPGIEKEPDDENEGGKERSLRRLKVLLVEDDRVSQTLTCKLLEKERHECLTARNQDEALAILRKFDPDIILMDVNLDGSASGLDITRKIRTSSALSAHRDIPIIALTAKAMEGDRERILASGVNEYISKPFRFEDLEKKIQAVMSRNVRREDYCSVRE